MTHLHLQASLDICTLQFYADTGTKGQVDAILENEGISDLEYLKSRMRQQSIDDDDHEEEDAGEKAPLSVDSSEGQRCAFDGPCSCLWRAISRDCQDTSKIFKAIEDRGSFPNCLDHEGFVAMLFAHQKTKCSV